MKGLFISGSGTDVGKPWIAQRLICLLAKSKIVAARKPVESGCELIAGKLIAKDALKLWQVSTANEAIERVCRFKFRSICDAQSASKIMGAELTLEQLTQACASREFVVVEGAGGLLSPIAKNSLNIDLAQSLNLPLVLVVKDELGAINQALLSIRAAQQVQLKIACVILNQFEPNTLNNAEAVRHYGGCEVVIYQAHSPDLFEQQMRSILNLD
jgi:dethiobiotin synthetase